MFEIGSGTFSKIRNGDEDAVLTIKFVDDKSQKRARLNINGHIESVQTDKAMFSKNINSKLSEGNNFVRLEPLEDLEVAELKIEIV